MNVGLMEGSTLKKNITIIEDDESINRGIELILGNTDYQYRHFYCLSEINVSDNPDLIILDINLPDGSGMDFLQTLRNTSQVPVLILTANDTEMDEVMGLELGADDYVTKPFSVMVLRLRVQKLIGKKVEEFIIERESLYIDFEHLIFKKNNQEIELSKTEIRLLRYFVENAGYTLTREKIIDYVWQNQEFVDENALSVIIKRLRVKTEDNKHKFIRTVYGIGYIWKWGEGNVY
jgi:DNA-binding response OmpR family regulator